MISNFQLKSIVSKYTTENDEITKFSNLVVFLIENEKLFGWRGKTKPNLLHEDGLEILAEKYFSAKFKVLVPSIPKTVPDYMASVILKKFYNYSQDKLKIISIEHQHSMAAENMVGELLERYIDSVLSQEGWIWCCGELVRHVDFIKQDKKRYRLLQIKNRDNSENSSGKTVRSGTVIEYWFRTFSRTGKTNWGAFPEVLFKSNLSEEGFAKFVENYNPYFNQILK